MEFIDNDIYFDDINKEKKTEQKLLALLDQESLQQT